MRFTFIPLVALLASGVPAVAQERRYSVVEPDTSIRPISPDIAAPKGRLLYGTIVTVTEEKIIDGKTFVGVASGWTEKKNLGSPKEFDDTMRPDDAVDVVKLPAGLELLMGQIYNTRGKYLKEKATELGIKPSALAAVLKAESSGHGFGTDGRQIIRFENHIFQKQWGEKHADEFDQHFQFDPKEKWKGQRWRKAADGEWQTFHGNQAKEWDVFTYARSLDENAALRSASYGAGQIMGFNHKAVGYDDAAAMVKAFDSGIRPQLDAVIAFIKNHPTCMKWLKADDYVTFAKGYNGVGKEKEYGATIKEAVDAYRKVTTGKKFAD